MFPTLTIWRSKLKEKIQLVQVKTDDLDKIASEYSSLNGFFLREMKSLSRQDNSCLEMVRSMEISSQWRRNERI